MTMKYGLDEGEHKSFGNYIYCDQCEQNGMPDQKIVIVYLGIRLANEPGFIYKFGTYDYLQDGTKMILQLVIYHKELMVENCDMA